MATSWTENGHMESGGTPTEELYAEVRRALGHLYDTVYLQRSPLARMLRARGEEDSLAGREAQALRRMLIQAIDQLSPGGNVPLRSEERRGYVVLRGRFVDQKSMETLAQSLSLSERQLRRELRAAVEAVTAIVSPQLEPLPDHDSLVDDEDLLTEIEALSLSREAVDLCTEARSVASLVAPLARDRNVVLVDELGVNSVVVRANRVVLRQGLLALCSWAIQHHCDSVLVSGIALREGEAAYTLRCRETSGRPPSLPPGDVVRPDLLAALKARLACRAIEEGRVLELWLPTMPTHSVLLVDDNRSLHLLVGRYLSGYPYSLLSAYDAPTGLELARREQPDAVMLDIMMPDQDGWELLSSLQKDEACQDIPVVICSVLEQEALAESLSAAGYLRKPITQEMLLGALRALGLGDLG
jgi:CheY-like chemotaxis protein